MKGKLIIIRHGESEWNARGKWTGTTDVHLTEKGWREARLLGEAIRDIKIDYAYVSEQIRSLETLQGMEKAMGYKIDYESDPGLNERDYGEYTGKNKWEMKRQVGEKKFNCIRRSWDCPIPGGETLKMVYARSQPFYVKQVVPRVEGGATVLLVAHGNSIRSLMKYIESISDRDIEDVEMIFGDILIYEIDGNGRMTGKQVRKIDTTPPPA